MSAEASRAVSGFSLQYAGENAVRRSANVEAIAHLSKGLELLKALPDTPEHAQQELTLQIALGSALMVTKGYAAPEVERAYIRARELCRQIGEAPQSVPVLNGLYGFYLNRAELQMAHELAEQLLRLAQNIQGPRLFLIAHNALGAVLYFLGEFVSARKHLEQGLTLYDALEGHLSDPLRRLRVIYLGWLASVLYFLGYVDQALQRSYEVLTLARELGWPFSP